MNEDEARESENREVRKEIQNNQCQYPGEEHPLDGTTMGAGSVIYEDDMHGIPEMIRICEYHYKIHILKYWPESQIAIWFRKQDESKKTLQASLLTNVKEE